MSKYSIRQLPRKRVLSRRAKFIAASLLVPASLLVISTVPVSAAAKKKSPVYATVQYVQSAINTALSPIKSAIASLQHTQGNQQTAITNLQNTQTTHTQQISSLQGAATGKHFEVYDANGQDLGVLVDHTPWSSPPSISVYSPALQRFMSLSLNNGDANTGTATIDNSFSPNFSPDFQSSDCTGTPYEAAIDVNTRSRYQDLFVSQHSDYYIIPDNEAPVTVTINSWGDWNESTGIFSCNPGPGYGTNPNQEYQLQQVNLPFTVPLAAPLKFKYQ